MNVSVAMSQETLFLLQAADEPELCFTLNCVPTPQLRPRRAKNGRMFKADRQRQHERTLELELGAWMPPRPLAGPLRLSFIAFMPIPESTSKKQRAIMISEKYCHIVKPDLDNLAKQLKDAMTRLGFWHDDRQVAALHCEKRYSPNPRWEVKLKILSGGSSCQD